MNEIDLSKNSASITDKKELIDAIAKLYSEDLMRDLAEILNNPPQSVADLQLAANKVLQAYHKANSFIQFQRSFEQLLK